MIRVHVFTQTFLGGGIKLQFTRQISNAIRPHTTQDQHIEVTFSSEERFGIPDYAAYIKVTAGKQEILERDVSRVTTTLAEILEAEAVYLITTNPKKISVIVDLVESHERSKIVEPKKGT